MGLEVIMKGGRRLHSCLPLCWSAWSQSLKLPADELILGQLGRVASRGQRRAAELRAVFLLRGYFWRQLSECVFSVGDLVPQCVSALHLCWSCSPQPPQVVFCCFLALCCVGPAGPSQSLFLDLSLDEWGRLAQISLTPVVFCCFELCISVLLLVNLTSNLLTISLHSKRYREKKIPASVCI